ncbi:MAG TPA: LysR substrate-binding domain-containing protein [Ramlibacter sp.]|uniref:LysR substrate-binding domain-containing protein n=1 Tax=Ramlibacter sp. TaxID=1917967 RepID=UPI002C0EE391|nr:LysR substrate-binding domain-containing protein [Ramlibacter sp.]HVZ44841.1 LysR substrate-binding domain-containing protein [Ramlibacter sp.]
MHSLRRKLPSANALFAFEAAGRCGNFTKAALELYVTQPAVSRMLARMEDHIGVRLFERAGGRVMLTEDGQILHRRIAEGFRGIETALDEIEARRTGMETVTLSISTAFTTHWLMPRMADLQKAFPHVELRFKLVPAFLKGPVEDVDLGIRYLAQGDPGRDHSTFLMPELLMAVCSPAYRDSHRGAPSPVEDTVVAISGGDRDWYARFDRFAQEGRRAAKVLDFSDYAIVVQAALLGQGVALGHVNVVTHWLLEGSLVPAVDEVRATDRDCVLAYPGARPLRPVVAQLRDWIVEEMRSDVARVDSIHAALDLRARSCATVRRS